MEGEAVPEESFQEYRWKRFKKMINNCTVSEIKCIQAFRNGEKVRQHDSDERI